MKVFPECKNNIDNKKILKNVLTDSFCLVIITKVAGEQHRHAPLAQLVEHLTLNQGV